MWLASIIFFQVVIVALHERMQAKAPCLTRLMLIAAAITTAMAIAESIINLKCVAMIISQQDLSAFRACFAVTQGLHGANGHAGAWTYLFLGLAVLKTRAFSRIIGMLSVLIGILWIPNFFIIEIGFKLLTPIYIGLCAVATIWIGIALLRQTPFQTTSKELAASR